MSRIWRPLIIFAAGAALGATLLGPVAARVAPAPAVTTYTRSASCAGYDFRPLDSATIGSRDGTIVYWVSGGDGFFVCDPNLPNGAVVTKVQFTLDDTSGDAEVRQCGLDRVDLRKPTGGAVQVLASVAGTGVAALPGTARPTTTTIHHPTVDNTNYAYWLQCGFSAVGYVGGYAVLGIYGATVIYKISGPNA